MQAGDWVVPLEPSQGTWRSSGTFKASAFHRVPNNLPLAAAATLAVNPMTALALLESFEELKPDDCVIQDGATSAVGQVGIDGSEVLFLLASVHVLLVCI